MHQSVHLDLWDDSSEAGDAASYELILTETHSYVRIQVKPIARDARKRSFNATIPPGLCKSLAKYFYGAAKRAGA